LRGPPFRPAPLLARHAHHAGGDLVGRPISAQDSGPAPRRRRPIAQEVCGKPFGIDGVRRQMRLQSGVYCDGRMVDSTALEYTLSPVAPSARLR